jgi:UDP-3-O-[3-hydroxymyristoyl] glucosamine N-acyltransferase
MNRLVYFEQIAGSARKFYLMTEDDGAICRDNTLVCDNALVKENAIVMDNATVAEDAIVCKNAVIGDDAYYTSRFTKL